MCVCLVAMNSIILLWVILVCLKSCDINHIRYLTRTCRLFADEHSLSFSEVKKKCQVSVYWKKNLSVLWEKESKCPKKNFQSVKKEKNVSVEFRVFGKKGNWKKSSEKIKVFFFGWKFKMKDFAKFVFTGWALC